MKRIKSVFNRLIILLFITIFGISFSNHAQSATTYLKDTTEPTSGVITGLTVDGGSFTRIFDPDHTSGNASADRGQLFTVPDNPSGLQFNIYEITLVSDAARDFTALPSAGITVWVFEWNPTGDANDRSNWTSGDGTNDGDPFNGTSITNFLVNGDTVASNLAYANGDFMHFQFSPPLVMNENSAYGILLSFDDGSGASTSTGDIQLQQSRDTAAPTGEAYLFGSILAPQPTTNNNNAQNNDDIRFYVVGNAIGSVPDSDMDGLLDAWELTNFGDLDQTATTDFDNDGLNELDEFNATTDPTNFDTDGDTIRDGAETSTTIYISIDNSGTNPLDRDSDDDGTPDGLEIENGLDPTDPASKLTRPNIIYIMCDDLGYGDLGVLYQNSVAGTKKMATPTSGYDCRGRHSTPQSLLPGSSLCAFQRFIYYWCASRSCECTK